MSSGFSFLFWYCFVFACVFNWVFSSWLLNLFPMKLFDNWMDNYHNWIMSCCQTRLLTLCSAFSNLAAACILTQVDESSPCLVCTEAANWAGPPPRPGTPPGTPPAADWTGTPPAPPVTDFCQVSIGKMFGQSNKDDSLWLMLLPGQREVRLMRFLIPFVIVPVVLLIVGCCAIPLYYDFCTDRTNNDILYYLSYT